MVLAGTTSDQYKRQNPLRTRRTLWQITTPGPSEVLGCAMIVVGKRQRRCTMYISMKRYTVSQAREKLAAVLDQADRTGSVLIERRNVQYVIRPRRVARTSRPRQSVIEILDPAISGGQWQWNWTAKGLTFSHRGRRR